jgi:hypothetical protein
MNNWFFGKGKYIQYLFEFGREINMTEAELSVDFDLFLPILVFSLPQHNCKNNSSPQATVLGKFLA